MKTLRRLRAVAGLLLGGPPVAFAALACGGGASGTCGGDGGPAVVACTCADGRAGTAPCSADEGLAGACTCTSEADGTWVLRWGDERAQDTIALAAVDDGLVVVGGFEGRIVVGTETLVSAGGRDILVVRLDPDGGARWARRYGGPGDDFAASVAVGEEGALYVGGGFSGRLAMGDLPELQADAQTDGFVAQFDAEGTPQWSRAWGSDGFDAFTRMTFDPVAGDVAVGGYFQGAVAHDDGTLLGGGGTDTMVARLGPDGASRFFTRLGGSANDFLGGLAVTGDGATWVAGGFQGRLGQLKDSAQGNAYLARVDPDGVYDFGTDTAFFVGEGRDDARGVAVVGERVWVAGRFTRRLERREGPGAQPGGREAAGAGDIFLTWSASVTEFGELTTYGDGAREEVTTLVSDGGARLLLAGGFEGMVDFGLGALEVPAPETSDGYAVALDGVTGAAIAQVSVASTGFAQVESAAFDPVTDRWWLAGRFQGELTLNGTRRLSEGASDLFVAAVRP
ncbi:MAG: hypothetical protein AAF928_15490 [Myxococcota bacterium]